MPLTFFTGWIGGNLGHAPKEFRYGENKESIGCGLRLAARDPLHKGEGDPKPIWFDIGVVGRMAEYLLEHAEKGDHCICKCDRLTVDAYQTKDGYPAATIKGQADIVELKKLSQSGTSAPQEDYGRDANPDPKPSHQSGNDDAPWG